MDKFQTIFKLFSGYFNTSLTNLNFILAFYYRYIVNYTLNLTLPFNYLVIFLANVLIFLRLWFLGLP